MSRNYCNHPDRHVPSIECGYPLPCPHHTVTIDVSSNRTIIPHLSRAAKAPIRNRVKELSRALRKKP